MWCPAAGLSLRAFAPAARQRAEYNVRHTSGWRQGRVASKELVLTAERESDVQRRHQRHVVPEAARLDKTIEVRRSALQGVEAQREDSQQAERAVASFASHSSYNHFKLAKPLTLHRNQIDGIPDPAQGPSRSADAVPEADRRAAISRAARTWNRHIVVCGSSGREAREIGVVMHLSSDHGGCTRAPTRSARVATVTKS
jgi:hypothetical protein